VCHPIEKQNHTCEIENTSDSLVFSMYMSKKIEIANIIEDSLLAI